MVSKTYTIGRSPDASIPILDSQRTVSALHAELTVTDAGRLYLTDRESTNGTTVLRQGAWVAVRQDFVVPQERIRLGAYEITVAQLLATLREPPVAKASSVQAPPAPAPGDEARRPRRNPETGEIIEG